MRERALHQTMETLRKRRCLRDAVHEVDKGADEQIDKDLEAGTKIFCTMMADDRISKYQSGLRPTAPIEKQRESVEPPIVLPTRTS